MNKSYLLNEKYPIKLRDADSPSNILWENIEVTNTNRFFRKFIFNFLIFISLLLTSSLVVLGSYYENL